jgi:Secretion system C-terminal sorting domain/Carbohydrate esterase, sialic acid-specific acetylesterase/Fibronectin type III domain
MSLSKFSICLFLIILSFFHLNAQRFSNVLFEKLPQDLQLYPRNPQNESEVEIKGIVEQNSISKISVLVFRNGKLYSYLSQNPVLNSINRSFGFKTKIKSELAEYDFYIYSHLNNTDSSLIVARKNIVSGDTYLITGQSNSYNGTLNIHGQLRSELYRGEYARSFGIFIEPDNFKDYNPADTLWNYSNIKNVVGMWGTELQKLIIEKYGIPVCIINGGSGGSSSEYNAIRDPNNPYSLNNAYGKLLYRVKKAGLTNDIKAFFYRQGESEADGASLSWKGNFEKIYQNLKMDLPVIKKIYLFQNNIYTFPNGLSGQLREHQRIMQLKYPDLNSISTVGTADFDGIHYEINGHIQTAKEVFRMVEEDFYGKEIDPNTQSPDIKKAFYNNESKTLTLAFNEGQEMVFPDAYELRPNTYIYIEEFLQIQNIFPSDIANSSADGNRIIIKLKNDNIGSQISYFPPYFPAGSIYTPFFKPNLTNKLGMRALTFENFPIKDALKTPILSLQKNKNKIELSWGEIQNSTKYIIERKIEDEQNYIQIGAVNFGQNLSFEYNILDETKNYLFRIRAVSSDTESDYSNVKSVTYFVNSPKFLSVKPLTNNEIELNWNTLNNSTDQINIEFSTNSNFTNPTVVTEFSVNSSIIIKNLSASTKYYFRLRTFRETENLYSNYSDVFSTKTLPNAPSEVMAMPVSESEIMIHWTDNSPDETKFIIEQSIDGQLFDQKIEVSSDQNGANIKNLKEASRYYFRIVAKNDENGVSANSNVSDTYTFPNAPTNLVGTPTTVSSIKLDWKDNSNGELKYEIFQEKPGTTDFIKIGEVAENISQYTVNQLLQGISYSFKVHAVGIAGVSVFSNITKSNTFAITGNEIENLEKYVSIFPNPSSEILNFKVDLNLPKTTKAKIYSPNGRLILEKIYPNVSKGVTNSISISDLKAGTYLLEIQHDKGKIVKKFLKN